MRISLGTTCHPRPSHHPNHRRCHHRGFGLVSALIGIACPQIVYPYLRGNVADVIQRAGFPPVQLQEINFQAMYQQQVAQSQSAPKAGEVKA